MKNTPRMERELLSHIVSCKPLPNDKILDMTKLKVFADEKFNLAKMTIALLTFSQTTNFRLFHTERVCR